MSSTDPPATAPSNVESAAESDDIALDEAFDRLSGRISTLTAAFDRFGLRQDELVGRDYSEDLAKIEQNWQRARDAFNRLIAQPALALTPAQIAEEIAVAGRSVRSEDHAKWHDACNQLTAVAQSLERRLGAARTRDQQNKWVGIGAGITAILAFVAGCTVPPAISRAAPESWHWPEQRAAKLLSRDMWGAGVRLMQTGNPESWNAFVRASDIYRRNADAIDFCGRQAQQKKKTVSCSVRIDPQTR